MPVQLERGDQVGVVVRGSQGAGSGAPARGGWEGSHQQVSRPSVAGGAAHQGGGEFGEIACEHADGQVMREHVNTEGKRMT